jgi:hypothetical protein
MKQSNKQAAQKNKINSITKNKREDYPTIGYMLWWTIRDAEITPSDLESRIDNTFGREFMPKSPSTGKAIKRGIESLESTGIITKIPSDNPGIIAYTLHRKDVDRKNIDLDLAKEQTIIFNKNENKIEVRDAYRKKEIMDMITKYSAIYTDSDLRLIILDYLHKAGAITMRETGGIYYTPNDNVRDALKTFIESNGGTFYSLGIPDTQQDKATIHRIVKDEIDTELQLATEELKQYLADDSSKNRTGVLESRIERFKEIKAKAVLYKELLSSDIEELTLQVDTVTEEVTQALSGELVNYPQAKEFPLRSKVEYNGNKVDKYGQFGVIVGYTYNLGLPYLRVQFENTKKVIVISPSRIKVIK